ncbi:hypothetical protein INR49_021975 [Caranx melampygus]|nr:hypothetical protein INR49_021975 [Caranx melampygus]
MDSDREEVEVFSETEEPSSLRQEEEEEGEEEEEEEDENEEEDARIFNAWMQQYRGGNQQEKIGEEEEEEEEEAGGRRAGSRSSLNPPVRMRTDRRASLPCPTTLSSMQLSRLHSSTRAPVTARVLLRRSSSRRLLPSPQEAATPMSVPPGERRPSLYPQSQRPWCMRGGPSSGDAT